MKKYARNSWLCVVGFCLLLGLTLYNHAWGWFNIVGMVGYVAGCVMFVYLHRLSMQKGNSDE